MATLKAIAGLPGGEVAFDYSNPIASVDDARRREAMKALEMKVARAGENIAFAFRHAGAAQKTHRAWIYPHRGLWPAGAR